MQIENDTATSRLLDDRLISRTPVITSVSLSGSTISDITLITPVANEITRVEYFVINGYHNFYGIPSPYAMVSVMQGLTQLIRIRIELSYQAQTTLIWDSPILLTPGTQAFIRISQVNSSGGHHYEVSALVNRYLIA